MIFNVAKNGERKNCEPLLRTIIGIINTIMDFTGRINANVVTYNLGNKYTDNFN